MILRVRLQVLSEVADALGHDGDLHVGVAAILLVCTELLDELCSALLRDAEFAGHVPTFLDAKASSLRRSPRFPLPYLWVAKRWSMETKRQAAVLSHSPIILRKRKAALKEKRPLRHMISTIER